MGVKIKSITGKIDGFGQISHNPHDYFAGLGGTQLLSLVSTQDPDVTIKTDKYTVCVYKILGKYVIQVVFGIKGVMPYTAHNVDKMYRNTASAECLVSAAENAVKLLNYKATRQYKTRLEERRRAEGYTQKQLSDITGIHVNVISRIERGDRDISNCEFGTVVKLARALECRAEDIA